jgi:hypothetical protein
MRSMIDHETVLVTEKNAIDEIGSVLADEIEDLRLLAQALLPQGGQNLCEGIDGLNRALEIIYANSYQLQTAIAKLEHDKRLKEQFDEIWRSK